MTLTAPFFATGAAFCFGCTACTVIETVAPFDSAPVPAETFHWNETNDEFEFTGYMSSYVLENLVAPRIGIPSRKRQRVYAELDRRAKILTKLHKEQGVTDFYEVLRVLSKAQRQGLF